MAVSRTHDLIDQISLIGQQKKSLGLFVQSPHRIDSQRIVQIFCHCCLLTLFFRTAYDSSWFIKKQQNFFFIFYHRNMIHADFIFQGNFLPAHGLLSVHGNPALFDHPVCFSS